MSGIMTFKIGENIKKLREFRGYSQEYMAAELDISQRTYSSIESDTGKVSKQQIEHIARVLEIDPLKLLSFDEKLVFTNQNCKQAWLYMNNTYNESSEKEHELYEKLIAEQKERINELKEEITFLRKQLDKK